MWEKFAQQTCQGTVARGCAENVSRSASQPDLEQRLQTAREAYMDHLLAGVPPKALDNRLRDIREMEHTLAVQLSTQVANDIALHEHVCHEIKVVENELKNQMRSTASDAESTLGGDSNVAKRKSRRSAAHTMLNL